MREEFRCGERKVRENRDTGLPLSLSPPPRPPVGRRPPFRFRSDLEAEDAACCTDIALLKRKESWIETLSVDRNHGGTIPSPSPPLIFAR